MWARIMRDRFGAGEPRSQMLRFHAQTGGSTLTAQQPEVNVVRVAVQALAAVCGGCQTLHTNGYDEALALPTERSATLALRTQQVLAHEGGTTATADPLGGSYYIEYLTDELERRADELIAEIDAAGGAVDAVEAGSCRTRSRNRRSAPSGRSRAARRSWSASTATWTAPTRRSRSTASTRRRSGGRSSARCAVRAERDSTAVEAALTALRTAARQADANVLEPMRDALAARGTVGEVCGVLREEWGTFDAQRSRL